MMFSRCPHDVLMFSILFPSGLVAVKALEVESKEAEAFGAVSDFSETTTMPIHPAPPQPGTTWSGDVFSFTLEDMHDLDLK